MLFSIIIPVYNAEKYIDNCIAGCLSQTFKDFEVILVLNGSTDSSGSICEKWASANNKIRILKTEVAGVSNARNLGIENAMGEWVVFADADDYLLTDALETFSLYINEEADLVVCNYVQKDLDRSLSNKQQIISSKDYIKAMLDPPGNFSSISGLTWNAGILGVNWAKAFRKSIISESNICFDTNLTIFEDLLFNLDYLYKAGSVICIDKPVYFYRINQLSLSRTCSVIRIMQRLDYIDNLKRRIKSEQDIGIKEALSFQAGQNMLRTFIVASKNTGEKHSARECMKNYLNDKSSRNILMKLRKDNLSLGKIQNKFFIVLLVLIRHRRYKLAFRVSEIYGKLKKRG